MKRLIIAAVAAAAVAAPVAAVAVPGAANAAYNPPCASRAEFGRIHVGQSVRTTQSIIGSAGHVTIAGSWMSQRQWHACSYTGAYWVTITYLSGRVNNKIML
jgi:hypothetical protein